ncbi:hypothetical protein WISP_36517 [Willisornis vidua]|uniref:Uncharacterized protein n=1 Tax=Willisornis vidua TaxID=1566151 RepID=A0ABQ9DID4_9PASS|nr:hypothetical protein WISP_36517 [Willisornis vidua]
MYKVITKSECSNDTAKEIKDKKIDQMLDVDPVDQWIRLANWKEVSTCQDVNRTQFSQGTDSPYAVLPQLSPIKKAEESSLSFLGF